MSILRKNIDERPYTGKRIVKGKLKLSEKEWLNMFFDGTPNAEQVTGVTRGKIYDVILVEGFGDVESVTFIDDNKDIQTLGGYFFEEVDEEVS